MKFEMHRHLLYWLSSSVALLWLCPTQRPTVQCIRCQWRRSLSCTVQQNGHRLANHCYMHWQSPFGCCGFLGEGALGVAPPLFWRDAKKIILVCLNDAAFDELILGRIVKILPPDNVRFEDVCTKFDFGRLRWRCLKRAPPRPFAGFKRATSKQKGQGG